KATSLSRNAVTDLLKDKMGYDGLVFTDALEMKGVAKFFPGGTIAVESLVAGNDMLCLPEDVGQTIEAVKKAIKDKKLRWDDIDTKVKKVLYSKYELGLNQWQPIEMNNLLEDLNAKTNEIRYEVARNTLTVLKNESNAFPITGKRKVAYIGIGTDKLNDFGKRIKEDLGGDAFFFT